MSWLKKAKENLDQLLLLFFFFFKKHAWFSLSITPSLLIKLKSVQNETRCNNFFFLKCLDHRSIWKRRVKPLSHPGGLALYFKELVDVSPSTEELKELQFFILENITTKSRCGGKNYSVNSQAPVQPQFNWDGFQWQSITLPWHPLRGGNCVVCHMNRNLVT